MPTAENSLLYYESGQTFVPMSALTDSGDSMAFNSSAEIWSDEAGFSPVVKADGIITGLVVTPAASGTSDKVDVSAGTINLAGIPVTMTASTDATCLRGATTDALVSAICRINSITITSAGAIAVLSGTDHTAFVETRGAPGGPPFIPVGSIELAQVRLSSITSSVIYTSEICSTPNQHRELSSYPVILKTEFARETDTIIGYAGATFSPAMTRSHIGNIPKNVYAQYYEPEFVEVSKATDFQPASNSMSTTSQQYYGGVIGEVSTSLKSGKFRAFLSNGVSDPILRKEGKKIWFKYYVDKLQTDNFILTQGYLGVTVSYPARSSIVADFTINANNPGKRITG
ncbi:MAG: hypothetical protein WCR46_20170 [Deltaproteobacteria bacterium]|jgi:hypothetical protein